MYSLQSVPSTPHHDAKQQEELEKEKNLRLQPNLKMREKGNPRT